MTFRPHTCPDCINGGPKDDPCDYCMGKGGYFCEEPDCALCEAVRDELELFRQGGHNATTLATNMIAKRYGTNVFEARFLLKDADEVRPGDA